MVFNALDHRVIVSFVTLLLLLCVSALVSGSETALFSLSPTNIHTIKHHHTRANSAILRLLSMQDYLLATVLIVNNLVNICIVLLSNTIIDRMVTFVGASVWEFVIKVIIVTSLLLLFGEIMPKIFAAYNSLKFSQLVAVPLLSLKSLFKPVSYLLIKSGNFINDMVAKRRRVNISIGELSNAIEITENQTAEEKQMLSGIISFVNTQVGEIMKPRLDVIALDIEDDYARVKQVIIESGFSRIPVYEETLDNIKGILYVKDMLAYIFESDGFGWQKFIRKPYFVPEHKKINDLLDEFQSNKVHVAIVVDEYGSTVGLISLEDILEEIVGEITDESDNDERSNYIKIDDRTYVFDGKTHLSDFEQVVRVGQEYFAQERGGAETVAGLMLEIKRDFLKKGESLVVRGMKLTVKELDGRRIDKVTVEIL